MSEARVERGPVSSFGILQKGKTGLFHGPWKHPALKTRLDLEFRGARVYITLRAKAENGNSGRVSPKSGSFVANGFAQIRYVWEPQAHQMASSPGLGEADAY